MLVPPGFSVVPVRFLCVPAALLAAALLLLLLLLVRIVTVIVVFIVPIPAPVIFVIVVVRGASGGLGPRLWWEEGAGTGGGVNMRPIRPSSYSSVRVCLFMYIHTYGTEPR